MKKEKREIILNGSLLGPLVIGQSALIRTSGKIYRTPRVVSIQEESSEYVSFNTLGSRYYVTLSPFPLAFVNPTPELLAA